MTPADLIASECDAIKAMLLDKNKRYGNSALEPLRLFSRANADEQLRVRIDDKLSRLRSAVHDDEEDAVGDLIGYLVLLRVNKRMGIEGFCRICGTYDGSEQAICDLCLERGDPEALVGTAA